MKILLLFALAILSGFVQRAEIVYLTTTNGSGYLVYNDDNLKKTQDGHLSSGKLAKSYTIEEAKDMQPFDNTRCETRVYEVSNPVLIVSEGSVINFFDRPGWPYDGSVRSCFIGNGKPMNVRTWGFPNGVVLPNNSQIIFESKIYCNGKCMSRGNSYWQIKCEMAILGADADLPGVGTVKKGKTVEFRINSAIAGCIENAFDGGTVVVY